MQITSSFDPTNASTKWDGFSLNTDRVDRDQNLSPDGDDHDRVVAEVIAIETALVDHEKRLGVNGEGGVPVATGIALATALGAAVNKTTISLTAVVVTSTDHTTNGASGSQEIFDFPEGNILILGGVASLAVAASSGGVSATAAMVLGIGSSAAATSSGDGTLATAEKDILPSTAFSLTGGTKAATKMVSTAQLIADGTASAKKAFLNLQIPDAGTSANGTVTLTGTITLNWIKLGDA